MEINGNDEEYISFFIVFLWRENPFQYIIKIDKSIY